MELKDYFLMQLEQETTLTRKVIERVPEGNNDWKPHQKSMALGYLAALVATMPGWVAFMIESDQLDFENPASDKFRTRAVETRAELLQLLADGSAKAKRALEGTDEKHLHDRWRLVSGTRVLSEGARYVMISDFGVVDPDVSAAQEAFMNNERPETQAMAERMRAVANGEPEWHHFDELYNSRVP